MMELFFLYLKKGEYFKWNIVILLSQNKNLKRIQNLKLNYYLKNKSLSRNKGIKIKDEFLERVKDYRKRLKDQMIKRNKFQYSHSNNSLNKSQSQRKEKEPDKEKENNEMVFNYNQNNNYIFNMNENVDKALNIFYNKLKNPKIIRYDREKSNLYQEKNISNLSGQEIYQNKFHTINIK